MFIIKHRLSTVRRPTWVLPHHVNDSLFTETTSNCTLYVQKPPQPNCSSLVWSTPETTAYVQPVTATDSTVPPSPFTDPLNCFILVSELQSQRSSAEMPLSSREIATIALPSIDPPGEQRKLPSPYNQPPFRRGTLTRGVNPAHVMLRTELRFPSSR